MIQARFQNIFMLFSRHTYISIFSILPQRHRIWYTKKVKLFVGVKPLFHTRTSQCILKEAKPMKLLAIDGNSIVNRAFYGIKLLTTKDGQYTNALVGFFNILSKLEQAEHPDEVAIAFDLKAPTFRHQMFDGYKAQRKGMPAELAAQMPVLKEMLSALGYRMVTCEGYEADDILGTLAQACRSRGDSCVIATGDRDSFQLVGGGVSVQYEGTKARRIDEDAIREQYGLSPAQLIDVKSLMGDTSDNIPGVAGVGEKTALSLIQKFGTLAGVYENIDDPAIKKGVREKLLRDREQAHMSRTLAEILTNAPIPTEPGAYTRGTVDGERAQTLFAQCEMFSTLQKLGLDSARTAQLDERPDTPILPAPEHYTGECFLFAHESGWCVVSEEKCSAFARMRKSQACFPAVYRCTALTQSRFCAVPMHWAHRWMPLCLTQSLRLTC